MEDCQNRRLLAFYKQNNTGRSLDLNQKMIRTERDINVDSESFFKKGSLTFEVTGQMYNINNTLEYSYIYF